MDITDPDDYDQYALAFSLLLHPPLALHTLDMRVTPVAHSPLVLVGLWLAGVATSVSSLHVQSTAYAMGLYGRAPAQKFYSSDATPPDINLLTLPRERESAPAGDVPLLTFIGVRALSSDVPHPAPTILDDWGELICESEVSLCEYMSSAYRERLGEGRAFGAVLNFGVNS